MTIAPEVSETPPAVLSQRPRRRYRRAVATRSRKTPQRTVGMDGRTWKGLDAAARATGSDRATVLRQFALYFMAEPGAKLPQRPDRRTWINTVDLDSHDD